MCKKASHVLLVSFLAVALGTLVGCQEYTDKKRAGLLNDTVRMYASSIRWGNFESAASAIRPRDGDPVPISVAHLKGVRVLSNDYQILAAAPDSPQAQMYATFTWQPASSASVRTTSQQATWWFDEQTQRWFLDGTSMPF